MAGPHPAEASASHVAPPPVDPAGLVIAPTRLGPTETPDVAPEPILPKMDSYFKERRLPPGYEQYASPTTQAADRPSLPPAPEAGE